MRLNYKNVVCASLLCLASLMVTETTEMFQTRAHETGSSARTFCLYDGKIYFSDQVLTFDETSVWKCQDSYAYSFSSRYIIFTMTDIRVNCNGFDNVQFFDNQGRYFDYCQSSRQNTVVYASESARWAGITRFGRVHFQLKISFTNTFNPGPVTQAPGFLTLPSTAFPPSTQSCGVASISPNENNLNKIVGGQIVVENSWPWQVGLKRFGSFFCGATLINDQWLLTAAHCEYSTNGLTAHLGDHNIQQDGSGELQANIQKWISHPEYDDLNIVNDIALVKLANKVTFTDKIKPVCLPNGRTPSIGETGFVIGWGVTDQFGNGDISIYLRQAVIPVNDESICDYGPLPESQICAGVRSSNPRDSCQGDSGGPFLVKDSNSRSFYIAGIVSYGIECGGRGAYTRVSSYDKWIRDTMAAN